MSSGSPGEETRGVEHGDGCESDGDGWPRAPRPFVDKRPTFLLTERVYNTDPLTISSLSTNLFYPTSTLSYPTMAALTRPNLVLTMPTTPALEATVLTRKFSSLFSSLPLLNMP